MMLTHHIDAHLLPHPEILPKQLMDELLAKLHRALVTLESSDLGISLPCYDATTCTLGTSLRVIGPESSLARLQAQRWLQGMQDHIQLSPISPIPARTEHRTLRRVQVKSNPERVRRRQIKRHGYTEEQARSLFPTCQAKSVHLPFATLHSASTAQDFRVYLRLGPPEPAAIQGPFNTYGLSTTATVPWF